MIDYAKSIWLHAIAIVAKARNKCASGERFEALNLVMGDLEDARRRDQLIMPDFPAVCPDCGQHCETHNGESDCAALQSGEAQAAPELDDKPDTIWVRVTDKSIMTRKPSDADEFDVEYRRADTLSGARMGAVVVAARKFLNDANSAWAAGEPLHKVRTMLDAADDLQAALDALQPGEAQPAPRDDAPEPITDAELISLAKQIKHVGKADLLANKIEDIIAEFGNDPRVALECVSEYLQLRRASTPPTASPDAALVEAAAKAIHDGPLCANDEVFDPQTHNGEWCVEVVKTVLAALRREAPQVTVQEAAKVLLDADKDEALNDAVYDAGITHSRFITALRALAGDGRRRQMKVLIVGGPNRGQVVDVEATPSNMLELVQVRDPVRGEAYWFKVEADVQDRHGYVMGELVRAYEYLMKGETHRQHIKKNGKL